jgi:adenylate kinase family enzyme
MNRAETRTDPQSPWTAVRGLLDWRRTTRLPAHIWIVGPCGGGKSLLADRLAARLGVEAIHLDEIHWNPGWIESAPEDEIRIVGELVERHDRGWIIDGNYDHIRAAHGRRADLFIWLDLPFLITFARLLWRCISRTFTREIICNGNRESLWETFCTKQSILLWAIQTHRRRRRTLEEELQDRPRLRLRNRRAVESWLDAVSP